MVLQFLSDPVGEVSMAVVLGSFWVVGAAKLGAAETRGLSWSVAAIVWGLHQLCQLT